jgi:GxxExxY protein
MDGDAELQRLTGAVLGAAIEVHRQLGPGLLESSYLACLAAELLDRRIPYRAQVPLALNYRGRPVGCAYRMDLVVADRLLVEAKAVEEFHPLHTAQVLTYLRLSGLHLALLINFNAIRLTDGIRRIVLDLPATPRPPRPPR